ncbi:MAG: hypothetical protein E7425_00105 [Ruminococcaceae bacterium]|nr:hypothetical protein [Oscillospiraceae bacterium]
MPGKNGVSIHTKRYNRFRGVDFSTDPALVDDTRSPWAPNMVSDRGGMPEKRPGWRMLKTLDGQINGMFSAEFGGTRHLLAHAGTRLWRWYTDETASETLATGLPNERSTAVFMGGYLWIFTGAKLLRYDGTVCVDASADAYVPLTMISSAPSGGGQSYEPVNLIGNRQRVGFLADGTSTVYKLPYDSVDAIGDVEVDGTVLASGVTRDAVHGTVTFVTAPAAPAAGAADNVQITFTKSIAGSADKIAKCTVATVWGVGGASDRIIAAGNPDLPNLDFICAYDDGTYWPDLNYAVIGTEETRIMGYCRLGDQLAIVKEENGQDSSVFLRSGYLDEDGEAVFAVKPCLAGVGAVTRFGFGNIGNEQLILTGGGVYALITNSLTAERIAQNRSFYVDPKLIREPLGEATACSYDGCFLIFVNGRVYGLDGRQPKSYTGKSDAEALYECFYWENVPARCALRTVDDGVETLWFGTADGKLCRFNTDREDLTRYSDDGAAIEAEWSTKMDDDGDVTVLKTLLKRGNAVELKPYISSSAKILFRTEKDPFEWQAAEGRMDQLFWERIDFSHFSFYVSDAPRTVPFRRKVKNYKRLQIVIKNDAADEGFGVYGIVKHYVFGNYAKE